MAFTRQAARTPVAIGNIEVRLFSPDPLGDETAAAAFVLIVHYDNGEQRTLKGDLIPHLTAGQISALMGFMDTLRAKAIAEILP